MRAPIEIYLRIESLNPMRMCKLFEGRRNNHAPGERAAKRMHALFLFVIVTVI